MWWTLSSLGTHWHVQLRMMNQLAIYWANFNAGRPLEPRDLQSSCLFGVCPGPERLAGCGGQIGAHETVINVNGVCADQVTTPDKLVSTQASAAMKASSWPTSALGLCHLG